MWMIANLLLMSSSMLSNVNPPRQRNNGREGQLSLISTFSEEDKLGCYERGWVQERGAGGVAAVRVAVKEHCAVKST